MNVYFIEPDKPFLDTLATAVRDGDLPGIEPATQDPLSLASTRIYLPTRRSCRALAEAFLETSDGAATILPSIQPIGERDEEQNLFDMLARAPSSQDALTTLPVIDWLDRRLTLTNLVRAYLETAGRGKGEQRSTLAQASGLAAELSDLIDALETDEADTDSFADLVPESLSGHWQQTLQFLQIVTTFWPAHLAECGRTSAIRARNETLDQLTAHFQQAAPPHPTVIAGVTGSVPATARLMKAVAALPNGAVVLPGFDRDLTPPDAWDTLADHPEHPQAGLYHLLGALGVDRADVRRLGPASREVTRSYFIAQALRPASTTEGWQSYIAQADTGDVERSLSQTTVLEAPSEEAEAEAVALIMREAVETPGKTAALVSPDRILARRVAVRLQQWGLKVDDSAGRPFVKTTAGAFLDLILETVQQNFRPAPLIAMLKHPLARLGMPAGEIRMAVRALELIAFRREYLGQGLDAIGEALDRAEAARSSGQRQSRAVRRLSDGNWQAARALFARLQQAFAPMLQAGSGDMSLAECSRAHALTAERLTEMPLPETPQSDSPQQKSGSRPSPIQADLFESERSNSTKPPEEAAISEPQTPFAAVWQGADGEVAAQFFADLIQQDRTPFVLEMSDYPEFYRSLVARQTVRSRNPVHPRLSIWGPYESRLQQVDVAILGGLNDGVWPSIGQPDAWLNRQMRSAVGLPAPEQIMGFAAHDFTNMLASPRVYLTRSAKKDNVPTVPSRWVLRMEALLEGLNLKHALAPRADEPWLAWADERDRPVGNPPVDPPAPCPPVAARPRTLSVTAIERWIASPYAIFAAHILGLEKMEALGSEPDARLRGQVIHEALHRYAIDHPDGAPDPQTIERGLARHASAILTELSADPRILAFWQPRFMRFVRWFATEEQVMRPAGTHTYSEVSGTLPIETAAGAFRLTARADRIDILGTSAAHIYDYKTGATAGAADVKALKSPQLSLEAAILEAGGFADIKAANDPPIKATGLTYISAPGGDPAGKITKVATANNGPSASELAADALTALRRLVEEFERSETPYRAMRRAMFSGKDGYRYDDFAHLARVDEWADRQPGANR